jgi:phasin family protein
MTTKNNNILAGFGPFADLAKDWNEKMQESRKNNSFLEAGNKFNQKARDFFENNKKKLPNIDMSSLSEIQRRNLEAGNSISEVISELSQELTRRNIEISQAKLQEVLDSTKQGFSATSIEEAFSKNNELAKSLLERQISDSRESWEIFSKSVLDAYGIVSKRTSDAVNELNDVTKKAEKKPAAKKAAA